MILGPFWRTFGNATAAAVADTPEWLSRQSRWVEPFETTNAQSAVVGTNMWVAPPVVTR